VEGHLHMAILSSGRDMTSCCSVILQQFEWDNRRPRFSESLIYGKAAI